MRARIFTILAVLVIVGMYVAGIIILAFQLRVSDTPAPLGLVAGGALLMFATVLAFALAFTKAAVLKD